MAGTTTYYGISYPTSTDYVKDGATAMQTIADGFDSAVAIPTYNNQTGTSYTFVLADTGKVVTSNNASSVTFTIPPQASVAWASNATLRIVNYGAGVVTVAGGSGVTVTNATATVSQYSAVSVVRTGSNAWTVVPFGGGASPITIDYLVIAGGGASGELGGGGGAGGYRTSAGTSGGGGAAESQLVCIKGTAYTVTVGAGGTGATGGSNGTSGSNSQLAGIIARGGGAGGGYDRAGIDGGSGGGAGRSVTTKAVGTWVQGYDGGIGNASWTSISAGGGGAGAVGQNVQSSNTAGNGGAGVASSITGTSVTRAGGGGGGASGGTNAGTGGSGGGGNGVTSGTGGDGTANTGGGAGGGAAAGGTGGNGGSGVVIIKIPDTNSATFSGGVTQSSTTSGGFKIYTVTATSTTSETVTFS